MDIEPKNDKRVYKLVLTGGKQFYCKKKKKTEKIFSAQVFHAKQQDLNGTTRV